MARVPAAARGAALVAAGAVALADRDLALDLAAVAVAGLLLYLGARQLLAGRARIALAGAALLALTAVVAVGRARPGPCTAGRSGGGADRGGQGSRARPALHRAGTPGASGRRALGQPPICFASMRDARAAAEGAAIPGGRGGEGARRRARLRPRGLGPRGALAAPLGDRAGLVALVRRDEEARAVEERDREREQEEAQQARKPMPMASRSPSRPRR